jgi:amidase
MFVADGGISVNKILDPVKEPIRPEMQAYADAQEVGVHAMWQMHLERTEFCKSYLDRWNACEGLDAILCKLYIPSCRIVILLTTNTRSYDTIRISRA